MLTVARGAAPRRSRPDRACPRSPGRLHRRLARLRARNDRLVPDRDARPAGTQGGDRAAGRPLSSIWTSSDLTKAALLVAVGLDVLISVRAPCCRRRGGRFKGVAPEFSTARE